MMMMMSMPTSHPLPKELLSQVRSKWEEIPSVPMDTLADKKKVFFCQQAGNDTLGVSGGGTLLTNGMNSPNHPVLWDEESEKADEEEMWQALSMISLEERARVFLIQDRQWIQKILLLQTALQQQARAGGVLVFVEDQLRCFCNAAGQAALTGTSRKNPRPQILNSMAIAELEFIVLPWEQVMKQLVPPEGTAPPIGSKDWLCENLLVADGQEPLDTMCLSSTVLEDLPRFREAIESLLDTQVWLLPIKRVSEEYMDKIIRLGATYKNGNAITSSGACILSSLGAVLARHLLASARAWRKRCLDNARPRCASLSRQSSRSQVLDVVLLLRGTLPSLVDGASVSMEPPQGGGQEFGSQSMSKLWRKMKSSDRMNLLTRLAQEGADELRRLGSSSDTCDGSYQRAAEHILCSNVVSMLPGQPCGAGDLAASTCSLARLAENEVVGDVLLEAVCMNRLARYTPNTAKVVGRLKKTVELCWADFNARQLLAEESEEQAKETEKKKPKKKKKKSKAAKGEKQSNPSDCELLSITSSATSSGSSPEKTSNDERPQPTGDQESACQNRSIAPEQQRSPPLKAKANNGHGQSISPERIEAEQKQGGTEIVPPLPPPPSPPEWRVRSIKGESTSSPPEMSRPAPADPPSGGDSVTSSPSKSAKKRSKEKAKKLAQKQQEQQKQPPQPQQSPNRNGSRGSSSSSSDQTPITTPPRNGKKAKGETSSSRSPDGPSRGKGKASDNPVYVPKAVQRPISGVGDESFIDNCEKGASPGKSNRGDNSFGNEGNPRSSADRLSSSPNRSNPQQDDRSQGGRPSQRTSKRDRGAPSPAISGVDVNEHSNSSMAPLTSPPTYDNKRQPPSPLLNPTSSPRLNPSSSPFSSGPPSPISSVPPSASNPWGRPRPSRGMEGDGRGPRNGGRAGKNRNKGGPPPSYPGPQGLPVEELPQGPIDLLAWDASVRLREQLSSEIEDMAASLMEVANRRRPWQLCALTRLEEVISRLWPSARMQVYGSFTTGLSIPASDVDVVITNMPEGLPWRNGGGHHLTVLAESLSSQDWVSSAQTIKHAAVPIVKLTTAPVPTRFGDTRGVIRIDVSFDWPAGTHRGVQSSTLVQRLCAMNRHLTPLVLVLKQLLLQRGLNDTYTGGLSSYALTIMVASILQRHVLEPPELQPDLGTLFLTFLQVFGTGFDTRRYGVCLSSSGPLFILSSWSPHVPRVGTPEYWQPADPVVIQDPLLPSQNVGRSCFGFRQVQLVFDECLDGIMRYVESWPHNLSLSPALDKAPLEAANGDDKPVGELKSPVLAPVQEVNEKNDMLSVTKEDQDEGNGAGMASTNEVHHHNHHHVGEGDCSILGLAVFGAHHHNQVMSLICQIWCPFEIPQHSPRLDSSGHSSQSDDSSNGGRHQRRRSSSFSGVRSLGASSYRSRGLSGGSARELLPGKGRNSPNEETRAEELAECHALLEELAGERDTLDAIYNDLKARHDRRVSLGQGNGLHRSPSLPLPPQSPATTTTSYTSSTR